jgi:hypothetical protein
MYAEKVIEVHQMLHWMKMTQSASSREHANRLKRLKKADYCRSNGTSDLVHVCSTASACRKPASFAVSSID